MKNFLTFLILLTMVSCDKTLDDDRTPIAATDIEGKWNLEKFVDEDGIEHQSTYIIFLWYEQGFEFSGKEEFYPRYDPNIEVGVNEWKTDYLVGPGSYEVSNGVLTLSFGDTFFDYMFKMIDENTIELSNETAGQNPWTGTWILVRTD